MAVQQSQDAFVNRARDFARLFKSQYGDVATANALWYGQTNNYQANLDDAAILAAYPGASPDDITALRAALTEVLYIVGQLNGLIAARLEPIGALA